MSIIQARKSVIDEISKDIFLVEDYDFSNVKVSKYGEPVYVYDYFILNEHAAVLSGYIPKSIILKVLKTLKSANLITDYYTSKKSEHTQDHIRIFGSYTTIIFTKSQLSSFGKQPVLKFDSDSGTLDYKGFKCKFRKTSKQFKLLEILALKQGKLVSMATLAKALWPETTKVNVIIKTNLYDTVRKIKDKLKEKKIVDDIFLEANDGYGLKK